jgi:hypothetical protein
MKIRILENVKVNEVVNKSLVLNADSIDLVLHTESDDRFIIVTRSNMKITVNKEQKEYLLK